MAETSSRNPPVPLSQTLTIGTVGQRISRRDIARDTIRTADLKSLARLVLARDSERDRSRNEASHNNAVAKRPMGHAGQVDLAPKRRGAERSVPKGGEVEEKRIGIGRNNSDIPRAWAEGFAQLDPNYPRGDVPPKRWRIFIDDVRQFLGSDFAGFAAALQWDPYDLFGSDRDVPFARIDAAGLLWLLNGNRLLMLSENAATIETETGARQVYVRRRSRRGRCLAWELVDKKSRGRAR